MGWSPIVLYLLVGGIGIIGCWGQNGNPCENTLEDTIQPCPPCPRKSWSLMSAEVDVVSSPPSPTPKRCSQKPFFKVTDTCNGKKVVDFQPDVDSDVDWTKAQACFNNDPSEFHKESSGTKNLNTVAEDYKLDAQSSFGTIGFAVPESPFFRYFLPPASKTTKQYDKFDIGQVKKYYIKDDPATGYDTDFELFEWPGKTALQQIGFLEVITKNNYGCVDDKIVHVDGEVKCAVPHVYVMLAFDREASKFQNYPCNAIKGTHVVAYGHVTKMTSAEVAEDKIELAKLNGHARQKVYLSHGTTSIHKEYIQPMFVRIVTLKELARPKDIPPPISATDPNHCAEGNLVDHRTVLDFSFATNRLILAMKCGILIVDHISDVSFTVRAAKLITSDHKSSYFTEPINKISGVVCCRDSGECFNNIVAAYSYSSSQKPDDLKFLYVSFDLGLTFEQKIIAPKSSLINLIQSMYRIYDRWDFYYKVLDHSDKTGSKYNSHPFVEKARKEEFKNFIGSNEEKYPIWSTLNPEEKENFLRIYSSGVTKFAINEQGKTHLRNVFCHRFVDFLNNVAANDAQPTTHGLNGRFWYPDIDYTPDWVKDSIAERYKKYVEPNLEDPSTWNRTRWNQAYCETISTCKDKFEEDKAVKELLRSYTERDADLFGEGDYPCHDEATYGWQSRTKAYTLKQNPGEAYCLEIVSLLALEQEHSVILLCKIGYCVTSAPGGDPDCSAVPPLTTGGKYAVFKADVSAKVPIISPIRRTKRIFHCELMDQDLRDTSNTPQKIEPYLFDVPKAESLLILNCKKVVYVANNAGRQVLNAVFYYKEINPTTNKLEYKRSNVFDGLAVPASVEMDANGHTLLGTFSNYYFYGIISYNREARLLIGSVFDRTGAMGQIDPSESVSVPWFSNSGQVQVSLIILEIIKREPEYKIYYGDRPALRLINIPISFYREIRPYFAENVLADETAKSSHWLFDECSTYAFTLKPTSIKLDLFDSATVQIQVTDRNPLLPLGIYTNYRKGMLVEAKLTNRSKGTPQANIKHDWDVKITSLPRYEDKEMALLNAFFGASYSRLIQRIVHIVFVNLPTLRCHVQPSGTVVAQIGCSGKRMVAHEDEYRPQCKFTFVNNFNYTLEKGQYDPELARYWLENNPEFVRREENGDLQIVYDYATFGCPLEPYQEDEFAPDLRIVDETTHRNTTQGTKYNGSYVLIEIFGATSGFNYTKTVGQAGCNVRPQTLQIMMNEWKIRRRIFNISGGRMNRWLHTSKADKGSLVFDGSGVKEHLNIWNQVNYRPCIQEEPTGPKLTHSEENEAYEIMNNVNVGPLDHINKLHWSDKKRPKVFIFLAIAVDDNGTFCNYYTWFGVSLPQAKELDDWWSILCFVIFTLLWILLVVFGYCCRKSYIRREYIEEARAEKLKQAAWTVIYRYEKLLHESENRELDNEMTQFAREVDEQKRLQAFEGKSGSKKSSKL